MPAPRVHPLPPRAPGPLAALGLPRLALPWLGSGAALLRDPTGFFAAARDALGDTFLVDAFGYRLLCVFSPAGVRALYAAPEEQASFALATYTLVFKHKIPLELALGRRNRPHDLFGGAEIEGYLASLERAVELSLAELGRAGHFEAFAFARRLGHRLGLACWAGVEAASPRHLDRLIPLFERLDSSDSFVRPWRSLAAVASGKWRERRAMRGIERVMAEILASRRRRGAPGDDDLARIEASWADLPPAERGVQVARDVMLIHMGAQSNLPAALGWTLVQLLRHPEHGAAAVAGDDEHLERCANEAIRLAQRSLTLRQVVQPLELALEHGHYRLEPGVFLATMLSVTNPCAAPGLEHFDPAHYRGRQLAPDVPLPARELVSTFGHGRHACPAQRFSISAIRIALRRLFERFELEPLFTGASPRRRQLGGVARAQAPCPVGYRARSPRPRPVRAGPGRAILGRRAAAPGSAGPASGREAP